MDSKDNFLDWINRVLPRTEKMPSGCIEFRGETTDKGYGSIRRGRKRIYVHRITKEIVEGVKLPTGQCVCHACDNPLCLNPDHLWVGTRKDNNEDRSKKGRSNRRSGEESRSRKIDFATAAAIRARYAVVKNQRTIASEFGVSKGLVWGVVNGIKWC